MRLLTALLLLAAVGPPPVAGDAADELPEVAVVRPGSLVVQEWWNGSGAADRAQAILIEPLAASGRYQVLPRDVVTQTLAQTRVLLSGRLSPGGAIRVGRELGVRYVVAGTLNEFGTSAEGTLGRRKRKLLGLGGLRGFKVDFTLSMFDVATGASVWSSRRQTEVPRRKPKDPESDDEERERVFAQTLAGLVADLGRELAEAAVAAPGEPASAAARNRL